MIGVVVNQDDKVEFHIPDVQLFSVLAQSIEDLALLVWQKATSSPGTMAKCR